MRVSGRTIWAFVFASLLLNVFLGGVVVSRFLPQMFGPPPRPPFIEAVFQAADALPEPKRSQVLTAWRMHDEDMRASFAAGRAASMKVLAELAGRDMTDAEAGALIASAGARIGDIGGSFLSGIRAATQSMTPAERKAFFADVQDRLSRMPPPPPRP